MRWEELLTELEAQFDHARNRPDDGEVAELAEAEVGQVRLVDRLRARQGADLTVHLSSSTTLAGKLHDVSREWLLLHTASGRVLVPLAALVAAGPLGGVAPPSQGLRDRLRITHVLRGLAREAVEVHLHSHAGDYRGWLSRVGRDHVDLQLASPGHGGAHDVTLSLAHLVSLRARHG